MNRNLDSNRLEIGFHLIFLILSLVVLGFSFGLKADDQRGIMVPGTTRAMPPMCTSRVLYGIECPGCGLTRAFIAISNGRFGRAWELNRASFFVYAFVLGQLPWHAIQLYRRKIGRPPLDWPGIYWMPIGLSLVLVVNWLFKMAGW
jgi:hypothetical protein